MSPPFKFKPEHFPYIPACRAINGNYLVEVVHVVDQANAALEAHLQTCERVYGAGVSPMLYSLWNMNKQSEATHTALLFNVEPLPSKPCKHLVVVASSAFTGECNVCGVKLKAAWEPCE